MGEIGVSGSKGQKGELGPKGNIGASGSIGISGSQGIQGFTGASGSIGIQGVQGFTGASGSIGAQGIQGSTSPLAVSNNVDNYVTTATGVAGTVTGESRLRWDGTDKLLIGNFDATIEGGIDLYEGTSDTTGSIVYTDGGLQFKVDQLTQLELDKGGSVNINYSGSRSMDTLSAGVLISGSLTVGNASLLDTTVGRIDATNDVIAFSTSDERFKDNITPISDAIDKISGIRGVEFDWKELTPEERKILHSNEGHDVGVIAQEIEKILPEVVTTRDSGYKAVRYEKIIPLLIEAIKDNKKSIEEILNKLK